jgi:hypothetical protein
MEIRAVTAGDLGGLVPGWRVPDPGAVARGRGDEIPTAIGDPAQARRGGARPDFAANVDGPWAHCDPTEISVELARLGRHAARGRTAGVDCDPADLTPQEAYVHGAAAAATWTVGLVARPPLAAGPLVVTDRTVAEQYARAEHVAGSPDRLRANFASGAAAWLAWLTGQWPCMEYPEG